MSNRWSDAVLRVLKRRTQSVFKQPFDYNGQRIRNLFLHKAQDFSCNQVFIISEAVFEVVNFEIDRNLNDGLGGSLDDIDASPSFNSTSQAITIHCSVNISFWSQASSSNRRLVQLGCSSPVDLRRRLWGVKWFILIEALTVMKWHTFYHNLSVRAWFCVRRSRWKACVLWVF